MIQDAGERWVRPDAARVRVIQIPGSPVVHGMNVRAVGVNGKVLGAANSPSFGQILAAGNLQQAELAAG